jgi:hypothetical protein
MSNEKKEQTRKKYGLLPPEIVESDIISLVHGLCAFGAYNYNKDTSQKTLSASTHRIEPEIKQRKKLHTGNDMLKSI